MEQNPGDLKMYNELASWWPLLSLPSDYAEEAQYYREQLQSWAARELQEVLELGCGGGNNASHMKAHFALTLSDLSEGMLAVSRALNPELPHHQGDMCSLRLGQLFDAVFVHDAISYLTSLEEIEAAIRTVWEHLRPGGVALLAPDDLRENYAPSTDCGGHDADGSLRAMRYLEWAWDPDPEDCTTVVDYSYTLRHEDGSVQLLHDRHTQGLFSRQQWLDTIQEVGFEARCQPFEHSEVEQGRHEIFLLRKPAPVA